MKKRAKICLYIFLVCAFCALGILGYFVFKPAGDNVMVGSKKFVTFNEVPGASSYSLSVKDESATTLQEYVANYTVEKKATAEKDEYSFKVEVFSETGEKLAQENYIQKITNKNTKENKINCIISNYTVVFFNDQNEEIETRTFKDQTLTDVSPNIFCCVVSEYFENLFVKDGNYKITFVAKDSEDNEIENSNQTLTYKYYAYYEKDFLRREKFFMNGEWYDYVVTNKEELKLLIWHTILYRQNNITFYVKTQDISSGNINSLAFDYINDYPEYDALNYSNTYATMRDNVGSLVNFTYFLNENFTQTFKDLKDKNSVAYNNAIKALREKDNNYLLDYISSENPTKDRTYEIDNAVDENGNEIYEVEVFNTEQLFMVVQYGARPVFEDETSVAYIVYNNAKKALSLANNGEDLTDYEKALNIYNYIANNVTYDYVSYKYMEQTGDFTIASNGNNSCFYLEGAFYDLSNQYAVCDGLAKAYVLMCNIEGIDCVKINGEVYSGGAWGNHAWNKVFINDEEYSINGWYNVDITWGVANYKELTLEGSNYYEIPTHTYFLRLGDEERKTSFDAGVNELGEDFDYYKNTFYTLGLITNDYYIVSDEELINIFDYAESELLTKDSIIIEIEIDKDYKGSEGLIKDFYNLYFNKKSVDYNEKMKIWLNKAQISNTVNKEWVVIDGSRIVFRLFK